MKLKSMGRTIGYGLVLLIASFCFAGALQAQTTLRLNAGFWPGDLEPELEDRYFKDDLILGAGLGRINNSWENKETYTIYPLGVQFFIPAGPGRVMFGGNYIRYQPEYEFTGFGLVYISDVKLGSYKTTDWEGEAGYEFPVTKEFIVTPRIGFRQHFKEFTYDEFSIGTDPVVAVADSSYFYAQARGMYLGLQLQYYIMPELSILADVMFTPGLPGWEGSMSQERNVYGVPSGLGSAFVNIERGEAGYRIDIWRVTLGVQYDLTKDLSLQVGIRQEELAQSYPDYFSIPIILSTVSAPSIAANTITEFITDRIFYEDEEIQTKGLFYFALSYDIDL